ncbi:MAG: hypothetical protein WDO69_21030 [Pseudomonadota bacterium]
MSQLDPRTARRPTGILIAGWLAIACAGAQPGASKADAATAPSAAPPVKDENSNSLAALRAKLSAGENSSELKLAAKGFGPELGSVLADSPSLASLTSLDVSDNDLAIEGARALARSPYLKAVRELDLGGNDIGDEGAQAIARATALSGLETLNVSGNSIASSGVSALTHGAFGRLSSLDLSMNGIGDAGTSALKSSELPLKSLYLLGCEIGPSGIKMLAQAKHLGKLDVLALSGNNLGDEGVEVLAKSTALQNLQTLDLCANGIGDAGALALAQSSHFKKLKVVELFGNEIGSRGSTALRKRFGSGLHL